jgi:hypothetical protein
VDREEGADEVHDRGEADGDARTQRPGGDRGRHGVGAVVEAVGEVEGQRGDDNDDEKQFRAHGPDVPVPRFRS